jgi:uncharacterized nucleotidyltransferase DUF6036
MLQRPARPPQPWDAFLTALDEQLHIPLTLYCIGGFVMTQLYGTARQTSDIDVIEMSPSDETDLVCKIAGLGSVLSKKHKVYFQHTAVQTVPENFQDRLTEMYPGCYPRLRLMALDPYDLALSKLQRNAQRDRDDVKYLAKSVPLDLNILRQRYELEMRPYFFSPEREDLTLKLWIDMIRDST